MNPKLIFDIQTESDFKQACIEVFRYQTTNNVLYKEYLAYRKCAVETVQNVEDIPFLPIELFKKHTVITGHGTPQIVFSSSGTTGAITSQHSVLDLSLYEASFMKTFAQFYGDVTQYAILALLPAYLERGGSSLVYMAQKLIECSKNSSSGFYLYNHTELQQTITQLELSGQPYILLGVSFALLDFAEQFPQTLRHGIVMETGGMKGRRREMIRAELHEYLQRQLGVASIHSEYGMTELLSQAYSKGEGYYFCPPWMKVLIRDAYDPYSYQSVGQAGCINVVDLANYHSCSFLETSDMGRINPDGSFEVTGRIDTSDVRGCNLMVL